MLASLRLRSLASSRDTFHVPSLVPTTMKPLPSSCSCSLSSAGLEPSRWEARSTGPLPLCFTSTWWLHGVCTVHPLCSAVKLICSPGGYVFITNMIPLHALVLVLMGRFSDRLYVAYSSWYAIGTLASMQVPFVGFQPVSTSEHMGALGKSHRLSKFIFRVFLTCLL